MKHNNWGLTPYVSPDDFRTHAFFHQNKSKKSRCIELQANCLNLKTQCPFNAYSIDQYDGEEFYVDAGILWPNNTVRFSFWVPYSHDLSIIGPQAIKDVVFNLIKYNREKATYIVVPNE